MSAPHLRALPGGASETADDVPPYHESAERSVLSAILLDAARAMPLVSDFLRAEHFFLEPHRRIFEACVALQRAGSPVDVVTVGAWLEANKRMRQVGGVPYLIEVADGCPVIPNVRAHAIAVHDAWRRREMIRACQGIAAAGYQAVGDVQSWVEGSQRKLAELVACNPVRPVESNDEALGRIVRDMFEPASTPDPGSVIACELPTGIAALDRMLGGLSRGSKTTVAALTGGGKSVFAQQVSVHLAERGHGVLMFATEMKRDEVLLRAVINRAGISNTRVKERRLTSKDRFALSEASKSLRALPWRIECTPRITVEEVVATTRSVQEEFAAAGVRLGLVVLDYIQRLEPSRIVAGKERHEQVTHATKAFKIMCQELDVAGLELAQAKEPDPRSRQKRPTAQASIGDSKNIAKEADDVVFLWAEDAGIDGKSDPRQSVSAIVAKQRNGATGDIPLLFRRDLYRFVDANAPGAQGNPSRQYVDDRSDVEDDS